MKVKPSSSSRGVIGIAGHAGIGHAFSHSGFFQEDSGGFAVLLTLLGRACPLDITIASVNFDEEENVIVTTMGGGVGMASARHGFSPYEKVMMQQAAGMRCAAVQTLASRVYGRVYGQGAGTQACAFSLALARALLDTVRIQWPSRTVGAQDAVPGCCGEFLGGVMEIDDVPVSWLLTINASCGGIGPNEDSEGCVPVGGKAVLMQELGMDAVPLIVLEGKAYVPDQQPPLTSNALFIRWNDEFDNPVVGECCVRAAKESGFPICVLSDTYPRESGFLREETQRLGRKIEKLGREYALAKTSSRKVIIMAELADICSHDAGGSIFMSEGVHRVAGNGGLWPGLGAMLSMVVTKSEADEWKTLRFTDGELELLADVLVKAAGYLQTRREEALVFVSERKPKISTEELWSMVAE